MNPLILLIGLPLLEIAVFVEVGSLIGTGPTLMLILAGVAIGVLILKAQGQAVIERMRVAAARGQPPVGAAFETFCVVAGALLLIVPGFLTDVVALLLLIKPVRAFLGRWLFRQVTAGPKVRVWAAGPFADRPRPPAPPPDVIEGEFRNLDDESRPGDAPRPPESDEPGNRRGGA